MIDDGKLRRRLIRFQLLIAIAALDEKPEADVGEWLHDLAEAMVTGDPVPAAERFDVAADAAGDAAFLKSVEDAGDDPPEGWPPRE